MTSSLLKVLKTILNFYKKRRDPRYPVPIYPEHFEAANFGKKAEKVVEVLTADQLQKFFFVLKNGKIPQYFYLALAQYCLSLRIGEACGLFWEDVDLEKNIIRISRTVVWDYWTWEPRFEAPKNGKVRLLVIPEMLAVELSKFSATCPSKEGLIFHRDGKPFSRKTVMNAFNRALDKIGVKNLRGTHFIRKTSATHANEITGDIYGIQKQLDHSSPNITLRYVAAGLESKQKIANALDSVLKGFKPEAPKLVENIKAENGYQEDMESKMMAPVPQRPPNAEKVKLRAVN